MDDSKNMAATTGTAITAPWPTDLKVVFGKEDGVVAIIARVRSEAMEKVKGLTAATKTGRDAISSVAYEVARRKTALDNAGKALNDELRVSINAVDAERRLIRDTLDALKDEIRAPVTKAEAVEAERVAALKSRLDRLANAVATLTHDATSEQIDALLSKVGATVIDDTWADLVVDAARAKDATATLLQRMLTDAKQREAEAAELARLRAEAEARAEQDRLRAIAEEAEHARLAAEKAEAERIARAVMDAQERAASLAEEARLAAEAETARLLAEAQANADAREKAAQDQLAAMEQQRADDLAREAMAREAAIIDTVAAEARHAVALGQAKAEADRAAQAERDRLAAQAQAEADAKAKREADANHRANIKASIVAALRTMAGNATPEAIADALMAGKIPHCVVVM